MKRRITGFDVARAFAIFGMVIVNFKTAMNTESSGAPFLIWLTGLLEGRASALFVILAGVGVSFLTQQARVTRDPGVIDKSRQSILKRGLFLIVLGLAYTPIWPADILHFYGFYFLVAAVLFSCSRKILLWSSIVITALFPALLMVVDYDKGWDWNTLAYHGFWSVDGMVRHIAFNGFHPIIPWCAFLLFGIWLGRQHLTSPAMQRKLGIQFFSIWALAESVVFVARQFAGNGDSLGLTPEEVSVLFSTSAMPPMPQYMVAAGSLAVWVIVCCVRLTQLFPASRALSWLYKTGQMSLTLYVAHVVIGMGVLDKIDRLENQTIEFSLLCALLFCGFSIMFSVFWIKYFRIGPMERLFRKVVNL